MSETAAPSVLSLFDTQVGGLLPNHSASAFLDSQNSGGSAFAAELNQVQQSHTRVSESRAGSETRHNQSERRGRADADHSSAHDASRTARSDEPGYSERSDRSTSASGPSEGSSTEPSDSGADVNRADDSGQRDERSAGRDEPHHREGAETDHQGDDEGGTDQPAVEATPAVIEPQHSVQVSEPETVLQTDEQMSQGLSPGESVDADAELQARPSEIHLKGSHTQTADTAHKSVLMSVELAAQKSAAIHQKPLATNAASVGPDASATDVELQASVVMPGLSAGKAPGGLHQGAVPVPVTEETKNPLRNQLMADTGAGQSETDTTTLQARQRAALLESRQSQQQAGEAMAAVAAERLQDKKQIQSMAQMFQMTPANAAEASSGRSSAENMFLSTAGGIVTAPVVHRTEGLSTSALNNAPMNVPVLQTGAEKAMAGNISWMVNAGLKNATVNVSPNGMGPISVQIAMENDQMNVSIVAVQGTTREALDAMLPRLKEQLASQGHQTVNVDVSDGQGDEAMNQERAGSYSGDDTPQTQAQASDVLPAYDRSRPDPVAPDPDSKEVTGLPLFNSRGQVYSRYDVYV